MASSSSTTSSPPSTPPVVTPTLRVGFQSNFHGFYNFQTQQFDASQGLRVRKFVSTNNVDIFGLPCLNINWSSPLIAPGNKFNDCIRKWFNPATTRADYSYFNDNENNSQNNSTLLQYGGTALIGRGIAALRYVPPLSTSGTSGGSSGGSGSGSVISKKLDKKDDKLGGRYVVQTFSGKCVGKFLHVMMVSLPTPTTVPTSTPTSRRGGNDDDVNDVNEDDEKVEEVVEDEEAANAALSPYEQQLHELKGEEPRTKLVMDIKQLVEEWKHNGDEMIIMMDIGGKEGGGGGDGDEEDKNGEVSSKNNGMTIMTTEAIYESFTVELGLDDVLISNNGGGSNKINGGGYIFASPTIGIVKCGRTTGTGTGTNALSVSSSSVLESDDESGLDEFVWIDVDATSVFGNDACQTCSGTTATTTDDDDTTSKISSVKNNENGATYNNVGSGGGGGVVHQVVQPTTVAVGPLYWSKKQREFELVVNSQVSDRTFRLRTYPKVFVGCEVVDALISSQVCEDRQDAVRFVQNLQLHVEGGKYFHHVVDPIAHPKFEDEYLFYRFYKDDDEKDEVGGDDDAQRGNNKSGSTSDHETDDDDTNTNHPKSILDASTKSSVSILSQQSSGSSSSSPMMEAATCPFDFQVDCHLLTKARSFVEHADVEDRYYRLKSYKGVFVGTEMVDSLIYYGICRSRDEAVELGRALQSSPYELFTCVLQTTKVHPTSQKRINNGNGNGGNTSEETGTLLFSDEFNFYKFNEEKIRMMNGGGDSDCGCSAIMEESAYKLVTSTDNVSNIIDLKEMSDKFFAYADVRHRRYRFKLYRDVFVGCELVDKLVEQNIAATRSEAVQLGRQLQKDMMLFRHVCDEHLFADEWYFYRFTDRNGKSKKRMTLKEKMRSKRNV